MKSLWIFNAAFIGAGVIHASRTAAVMRKSCMEFIYDMESRGDVATSTSGNANLQKMLAGMSFESLLKQAGDAVPPEAVKALNDALQKVKKS